MTTILRFLQGCTVLSVLASPLVADSLSFSGVFTQDDNQAVFSFNIPVEEVVTMRTWSYAGGTNAAGTMISAGGFDPVLTLFDSSGNWQGANDDGTGQVAADRTTGNAFDSLLAVNLLAGAYTLYLTESDNTAVDAFLSDGFTQDGMGNFSCLEFIGQPGSFCDATPAFRDGNYAVDIQADAVSPPAAPEPGTAGLLLLAAGAAALWRSKRLVRRHAAVWLLALALPPLSGFAADVPLVADTYTSGSIPTLNFGGLANLNVGNTANNNVALVKFDLSVLPVAGIARATLRVFINKIGTPGAIDVLAASSPWLENAVTGQFPPALGAMVATAIPVSLANEYLYIDVTSIVQNQVFLSQFYPNNGFAIVANASAPGTAIFLDSKESTATSHPATLDVTLVGPAGAQGPAGPAGATGATGASGPQGTAGNAGVTGPQGIQGIAGAAGPQGSAGLAGAQGSAGSAGAPGAPGAPGPSGQAGANGATGPAGLRWLGAWNADPNFSYSTNDAVGFSGSSYVAIGANGGQQPNINPQSWTLLASAGSQGAAGAAGTQGTAGPQGLMGAAGAMGAAGPQGVPGVTGATGAQGAPASFSIPANPFFAQWNIASIDKAAGPGSGVVAVTSITITSFATATSSLELVLGQMTQASCGGTLAKAYQPDFFVSVPAGQTVHLTFPTPLVFNGPAAGIPTCVDAGFSGGSITGQVSIAVNGYVI